MAENKQIRYAVQVWDNNGHLLQPNYHITIPYGATGYGFYVSDPSASASGNTAQAATLQYIALADAKNTEKHCGYPTALTSLIGKSGTTATNFPALSFDFTFDNIMTLGGITLRFVGDNGRHSITINPYGTDKLTFNYIKDNVNCGYVTTPMTFDTDARAMTIPWLYPVDNNAHLRTYAIQPGKINDLSYRIVFPSYGVSGEWGWPTRVDNLSYGTNVTNVHQFFTDLPEPYDWDDPYADIPNSEPSGPAEGVGIPTTDAVDIPDLPSVSATDTGFVSLFNPTLQQVKDLADYMWAGLFDIATFRKIFADPMDCILGFNMVPVNVPSGGNAAVRVGNISTGVQMHVATGQWVELDCGSVTVDLPYGNYLDFAPYSKFSLYLPYIGMVELSTDDVMGRVLSLKYHVDVLSCACVAYLKCGPDVLYQFTGSCGYSIPVTGDNFRQMISNIVSLAATIGGAIVSGGAAVPVVTGAMTAKQAAKAAAKAAAMKQAQAATAIGTAESTANSVMGSKPDVHRSGALGSSAGLMGIQKPFLIMELPNACKPEKQYHYMGYPGFITVTVGDLTGFAEFESIILDGIPCTEDERDQITALCAGGIYL